MMTNKSNLLQNRLLLICACFIFTIHLSAQSSQNNKWQLLVEPYLMFPNMHGTTGMGNLPDAEVDENPSDIFKNLQIAAMLYAEAHKGGFTISSDLTYMKLGDNVVGTHGILTGDVNVKQLTWELAGLYKLRPWLNAGIGLQLNSIKSKANLTLNTSPTISSNSSSSETWLDPSIIAATKLPLPKTINGSGSFALILAVLALVQTCITNFKPISVMLFQDVARHLQATGLLILIMKKEITTTAFYTI